MQFAAIDLGGGKLDFLVLEDRRGDQLVGINALNGLRQQVPVASAIHLGMTGGDPNAILQFAPNWISAQLSRGARGAVAANPKMPKTMGWQYQTGQIKWTPDARSDRAKEIARFKKAVEGRPLEPIWATLDVDRVYGYDKVREMLEWHQRERDSDALWWCFVFAILTAAEDTNAAEKNVHGFWKLMAPRLVQFGPNPGLMTFREFKPLVSGFQEQRYRYINHLARDWERIASIVQDSRLSGRPLRNKLLLEAQPLGLAVTKGTFALELFGQDVACLDRWIMRAISDRAYSSGKTDPTAALRRANKIIETHCRYAAKQGVALDPTACRPIRTEAGTYDPFDEEMYALSGYYVNQRFASVTGSSIKDYEHFEDKLKAGPYYRLAVALRAPNPLARAQWTMWEDILRKASDRPEATHGVVFEAIRGTRELRARMIAAGEPLLGEREAARVVGSIARQDLAIDEELRRAAEKLAADKIKIREKAAAKRAARENPTNLPPDIVFQIRYDKHGDFDVRATTRLETVGEIALSRFSGDMFQVAGLDVEEKWQRRGIATELYRRAIAEARKHGAKIVSQPGSRSKMANKLHESLKKTLPHERGPGGADIYPNPNGIARHFAEALAWKRKEVEHASPAAKRLARTLSEAALVEFARA